MKKAILILAAVVTCCLLRPTQCQAAAYAYVTNLNDHTLWVIRITDDTPIKTISDVGTGPFGVAVTPDGEYVYVTNRDDGTVSVIETATNMVIGDPIPVGTAPVGVAVTPDGEYVYVTNRDDGTVSVIETATNMVIGDPIPVGTAPFGAAAAPPDGEYVYVTNRDDGTVSVIQAATNTVINDPIHPIEVGKEPHGVTVTPDGSRVYVANLADGTVSVIETYNDSVIKAIGVGDGPGGVAVTPDGSRAYATSFVDNAISVIRTSDNTVINTINAGKGPTGFGQFIASISAPEAPRDLAGSTESDSQIDLSWSDNSFDELGFEIERKRAAEEAYTVIASLGPNVTSYSDDGLEPDTTYSYRVRAYNGHGNSDYSDEAETTTATILDAPTNLTATGVSHSRIRLSWTDNSFGESGFTIERMTVTEEADNETAGEPDASDSATDSDEFNSAASQTVGGGSFSEIAKVGANVTSYGDSDLEPYTTYRYRVQAYDDAGGVSGYSNEVEKRTKDDCFIATAAYGSLMEPHVVTLRHFRDVYLIPHALGRVFVNAYYATSPPIAHFISKHEMLRAAVRASLLPLVAFSYSMLHLGLTLTLTILVCVVVFPVSFLWLCQKKRRDHKTLG